ncbi:MAG: hypothetical protein IPG19_19685 [Burkholderiales bacterium]|nr:hypothetical protein [Burkholderiales bacterium]
MTLNSPTDGTYLARAPQQQTISIRGAHAQPEEQHYALQHSLPNGKVPSPSAPGAWSVQRGQKAPFERHKSVSSSVLW